MSKGDTSLCFAAGVAQPVKFTVATRKLALHNDGTRTIALGICLCASMRLKRRLNLSCRILYLS